MNPIDTLLEAIDWKPTGQVPEGDGLVATHEGWIGLGGKSIRVMILSNGQRVFDLNDLADFLGTTPEEIQRLTADLGR